MSCIREIFVQISSVKPDIHVEVIPGFCATSLAILPLSFAICLRIHST